MSDYSEILDAIKEAKAQMAHRDMVLRLTENPEYDFIINKGYIEGESIRLTSLMGDPNEQMDQEAVINGLHGVAAFRRYLSGIIRMGNIAERELASLEEAAEDLRTHGEDE